jgi:hypothetical protein
MKSESVCESIPPPSTHTHTPHTHKCAQIHTSVWDSKASSKALSRLCNGFASTGCAHPISRAVCMCMLCVYLCVCARVCVQACVHAWIWQIYNVCVCMRARAVCGCTYPQRPMLCPVQSAHECAHVFQFLVSRICTYIHICIHQYVFMYVYVYAHVYECAHTQITGDPTK